MDMNRIRMTCSGFPGAPGFTTFYVSDPVPFLPAMPPHLPSTHHPLPLASTRPPGAYWPRSASPL